MIKKEKTIIKQQQKTILEKQKKRLTDDLMTTIFNMSGFTQKRWSKFKKAFIEIGETNKELKQINKELKECKNKTR
jgi:hypothetical protein